MVSPVRKADQFELLHRLFRRLSLLDTGQNEWQLDVFLGSENWKKVVRLKDEAHSAGAVLAEVVVRHLGDYIASYLDLTALDRIKPRQAVEQRGLPRSARPHHRDHFTLFNADVDTIQCSHFHVARTVDLRDAARLDNGLRFHGKAPREIDVVGVDTGWLVYLANACYDANYGSDWEVRTESATNPKYKSANTSSNQKRATLLVPATDFYVMPTLGFDGSTGEDRPMEFEVVNIDATDAVLGFDGIRGVGKVEA